MSAVPVEVIGGRRVLVAMATEAEYGPALRARVRRFHTGVGPVEAGVAMAWVLTQAEVDLVVSLGSAGSARLPQGAVYQVHAVAYRDMDASPLGFARGETPFSGLPRVLPLPAPLPGVPAATLSTGGGIVSGAGYAAIPEDMVDMETFAVARACQRAGVPLLGLRGISDGQAPLTGLQGWTELLPLLDRRLAEALDLLARELAAGRAV